MPEGLLSCLPTPIALAALPLLLRPGVFIVMFVWALDKAARF